MDSKGLEKVPRKLGTFVPDSVAFGDRPEVGHTINTPHPSVHETTVKTPRVVLIRVLFSQGEWGHQGWAECH